MVSPVAILFPLKNAPNCTSEHPYFPKKIFWVHAPRPPYGTPLTRKAASREVGFAHQKNYPQRFSGSAPAAWKQNVSQGHPSLGKSLLQTYHTTEHELLGTYFLFLLCTNRIEYLLCNDVVNLTTTSMLTSAMPCHRISSIMFSSLTGFTDFRIDIACLFNMLIPASVFSVHMHWGMGAFRGRHILEYNTFCPGAGCQGGHLQGGHPALPRRDQVNSSQLSNLAEMPISTVDRSQQIHNVDQIHSQPT